MINNFDLELVPEDQRRASFEKQILEVPSYESEFLHAKAFLQKCSNVTGDNLYDHLTDVLNKILAERPENVIDFFEEYSRKVKEKRFKPMTDHFEDIYVPPGRYRLANKLMPLLRPLPQGEPSTLDPDDLDLADMSKNDILQLLYFLEQVGLGLPKTEMFAITISMKKLIQSEPIASIKFWGKIFGLQKNYVILETELKEEEYIRVNESLLKDKEDVQVEEFVNIEPNEHILDEIAQLEEIVGEEPVEIKLWDFLPPLPISDYQEPPEPPSEPAGVGVNRKVYYVTNEVGNIWVRLPDLTPKHIRAARQIYVAFTGNLDQAIDSYPAFPGTEREYLRAQIARISACTHISPLGYYTMGGEAMGEEEAEDEEAEGGTGEFRENIKYDPVLIKDLIDTSMLFWVHHIPYILPQGRTTWWNPNPLPELGEELGEEEEEGPPRGIGPEPETGPALLTPCSEDVSMDAMPAWSVRISTKLTEEYAISVVRSNFWPGAYCFSTQGKLFQNIYFGNGNKYMSNNFSPTPLSNVEQDYPIGPEIMEILDPTGAEEEEWRIAHLPKPPIPQLPLGPEGEPGEGAEEEEEEEDDD